MKYLLLFFVLSYGSELVFSQNDSNDSVKLFTLEPDTLFVSKSKCNCNYSGYGLIIHESLYSNSEAKCGDYSYQLLFTANDRLKIDLIEQLLSFGNDTSRACSRVYCYSTNSLRYSDKIFSKQYTIQISSLYHVNMICFAQYAAFRYSPFPVLVDTITGQEINNDPSAIREVYKIYKDWFIENKKAGFKNYQFPLLHTRYKWKFGDYSKEILMQELPVIKSDYKYRIGRPVKN